MKIAILGVGSFVFGPSALHDAIVRHQFAGTELALFDPNREAIELMADVGRQMAAAVSLPIKITCHETQSGGIDGADFVVFAAAVQVRQRFAKDCEIIHEIYPEHLITEFGGVAGISYTLRQVALIRTLAADMRRYCANAWLLTSANPLPRVCQAAHLEGIKVAGFCSNSSQVFEAIGRVMLGKRESFPWPVTSARYEVEMAGVNHLTWLVRLIDRQSSANVTDDFVARIKQGEGGIAGERPMTMELLQTHGLYPPNGDSHMADFLKPTGHTKSLEVSTHGNAGERKARHQALVDIAAGKTHYSGILDHRAWEMPMDFVAGIANGESVRFNSLNLVNQDGQLPQLPKGAIVETSVRINKGQIQPTTNQLPDGIANVCRSTAGVSDAMTRAGLQKDRNLLAEAVELDPTILDKKRGIEAVNACMAAHADLIGSW